MSRKQQLFGEPRFDEATNKTYESGGPSPNVKLGTVNRPGNEPEKGGPTGDD